MITVQLPDGSTAQFPDGTPPEQIKAAIQKKFPPAGGALATAPATPPAAPPTERPNFANSSLATIQGITGAVPFLQPASDAIISGAQTAGDVFSGQPPDFGKHYQAIQDRRQQLSRTAPVAQFMGGLGGTMALSGLAGAVPAGAEALGLTGGFLKQLGNAALSTAGYEGLQGLSHGHTGGQLLADEGLGAASGMAGSLVGQGLSKIGEKVSSAISNARQAKLTNAAIENVPSASDLFSTGSDLFEKATGGSPLQITDNAYTRLLGDIQDSTKKFRPNENTSKEAVGLLQKLWGISDELNAGTGAVVDFKDLHILRQSANSVRTTPGASNESKTIAAIIVNKIDDFIGGLRPADIAGGADPSMVGNALLQGISTWHKASKVSMIESAIREADAYKSGTEMGLKATFSKLMKSPEYLNNVFTAPEKAAIREVAKGTTMQNAMALLGRSGFSLGGGGGHNIIGGTLGAMAGTTALTPLLGPLAPIASLGLSMGASAGGRAAADRIATGGAERAAQVMAAPFIPVAPQLPNMLAGMKPGADLLTRAGLLQAIRP